MASFFESVKAYVGFGDEDAGVLRTFRPGAAPHFERIADLFYDSIARDPDAEAVMRGGAAQVERLKQSLVGWLETGLEGPHDEAYYDRRTRIGHQHVRIALPQRYMLTAMNVIRSELHALCEVLYASDASVRRSVARAIDRLLDMELAIMLETYKEDSETQLRRKERLASMGQFAGMIGHELRNPLSVIESSLFLLQKKTPSDPSVDRHFDKMAAQVRKASQIIADLLEMTRDRPAALERIDLGLLIDGVLEEGVAIPHTVKVHRQLDPGVELHGETPLVARALENLVSNAILAFHGHPGNVWVAAETSEAGDSVVTVRDDGPGFAKEILPEALEPLVTNRASGVGLGLALVHNVCARHGGAVELANHPEGGALVRMIFPRGER